MLVSWIIAEIEAKMSADDRISNEFFPDILHVLREKLDASGKKTPVSSSLSSVASRQQAARFTAPVSSSNGRIAAAEEDVGERLRKVEDQISGLGHKFDRLFTILDK